MDTEWVLEQVQALGQIGYRDGHGRTRLAYTDADAQGVAFVRALMEQLGLKVRRDAAGNLFGRYEGLDAAAPALLIGSHVDTVPEAGAWDGCLGVLAALGTIRGLALAGLRPRRSIEVAVFMGEESSRFGIACIGSRIFAGALSPSGLEKYRDDAGVTLKEALEAAGADAEAIKQAATNPARWAGYLEVHIDQGNFLDLAEQSVGVVTGIAAPERWRFTLHGEAAHSGAAAMEGRKDALMAAAHILSKVERIVRAEAEYGTVATVGQLNVSPNSMNVVPGEVTFSLDVRGIHVGSRNRVVQKIQRAIGREVKRRGMTYTGQLLKVDEPVPMDAELQRVLADAAREAGVPWMPMPSMAGHDASYVALVCPAAMLLVRNVSRTSHSPLEQPAQEHVVDALQVFDRAVRHLAFAAEFPSE